MTIEVENSFALDSYANNDVYVLPESSRHDDLSVASVAWITRNTKGVRAAQQDCTRVAVEQVRETIPDQQFWLVCCNAAMQPDNRISRHRKLWSSLESRGLTIPVGRRIDERIQESANGIRWYSAVEFSINELMHAARIIEDEPTSCIVSIAPDEVAKIEKLVETGWERVDVGPSPNVLTSLVDCDGIVYLPVGAFDECEAGVVAFTSPKSVRRIIRL